jgi:nitrogen regulatory protein PII-like uncharacterized protein
MCYFLHNINNFYKNNNAKKLEEKNKENRNTDRYSIIQHNIHTISNESADFSCRTI